MENQNQSQKAVLDPKWAYRGRAFGNILKMGHCAPAVMQTILDGSAAEQEWLVRLSAGLPGGIGNTGHECGGVTSPLVLLGIRYGLRHAQAGLPLIFDKGQALCSSFLACHKTMKCKEIRGKDRFPLHCIPPVTRAQELYLAALDGHPQQAIPAARRAGYARLYAHMIDNDFHCAQAVLFQLGYNPGDHQELFDAVSAFLGGTLFMGKTCSAFTAGVMAIGLKAGEIENSIPRVIRLLAIMTVGGNAFDDGINKFNRSMNLGYRLSKWFVKEFGSTQCQAITRCDFSDPADVTKYIEAGCITRCRVITDKVAGQVDRLLAADPHPIPDPDGNPQV